MRINIYSTILNMKRGRIMEILSKEVEIESEFIEKVNDLLQSYDTNKSEKISLEIVNTFTKIEAPKKRSINPRMGEKTFNKDLYSDNIFSVKPGNIIFNWKKLLKLTSSIILTVGSLSQPWLIPFAGIMILDSFFSDMKINLSENHGAVIYAMWNSRDENNCVKDEKILDLVNEELKKNNHTPIDKKELKKILNHLQKLRSVKKHEDSWQIIERVKESYIYDV